MKKWEIRRADNSLAHVLWQEEQPGASVLAAFGNVTAVDTPFDPSEYTEYRTALEIEKRQNRREFGTYIIDKFSAENELLGLSVEQSFVIIMRLSSVVPLLQVGALETALAAMSQVEVDELLPSSRRDGYMAEIMAFLQSA